MSDFHKLLREAERKAQDNHIPPASSDSETDLLHEFRVDLIARIKDGIPERQFVPGCDGFLLGGKRYLAFAAAGVGKSIAALVVGVEVVAQNGRVVILDVENGADEYVRRFADILEGRDDVAAACSERLAYYEFPRLKLDWTPEEWIRSINGADLVVFDSSRLTLSSVGLSEDATTIRQVRERPRRAARP